MSAFFSGMEIAFVSSNKLRFEVEREEASITATIIEKFYRHPQQFITTMLVGNNIVLVVFSIKMNELLLPYFSFTQNGILISLLVSLVATIIVLFFGEYLPKMIMRQSPNTWLRVFSPLLYIIYVLLYPIALFCTWISELFLRIGGIKIKGDSKSQISFSRADLNYLIEELSQEQPEHGSDQSEDAPSENEIQILQNALDFSKVKIRDCYVPRTDVVALPYEVSEEELKQAFEESGFSKIPVFKGDIDNIIGYIHCSEMFEHQHTWREHINQMPFVTENMAAQKVMRLFMQQKKSIAVVIDEFGGTAGIVTLEDIFEEIFGEIEDEHDQHEFTAKQISEREIIASARIEVETINEEFDLALPTDDSYDTLGGLILNHKGAFPKTNEEIIIGSYKIKCLKMANNRIERVKITW